MGPVRGFKAHQELHRFRDGVSGSGSGSGCRAAVYGGARGVPAGPGSDPDPGGRAVSGPGPGPDPGPGLGRVVSRRIQIRFRFVSGSFRILANPSESSRTLKNR